MEQKKYSSYEQIDQDLKILKLKKEIHYRKLIQKGQETKQSLNFVSVLPDVAISAVGTFVKGAKGAILGYLLRALFRRR